jgi:hypothetical protein
MLVCESMDACISVCTIPMSSIHRLSRLIPSIEFSPTNSPEDEGMLFFRSNPLIISKLLLAERLVLLHLLGAMDGNVIAVHGHRSVIVCKIVD